MTRSSCPYTDTCARVIKSCIGNSPRDPRMCTILIHKANIYRVIGFSSVVISRLSFLNRRIGVRVSHGPYIIILEYRLAKSIKAICIMSTCISRISGKRFFFLPSMKPTPIKYYCFANRTLKRVCIYKGADLNSIVILNVSTKKKTNIVPRP